MPEEFIEDVCKIIKTDNVKTVVFIDLKSIGASYPFLMESPTSGSLFLSVFTYIMRNYGVNLIFSSSNDVKLKESKEQIERARLLSDAVIECVRESEGVSLKGEGLLVNNKKYHINIASNEKSINYVIKYENKSKLLSINNGMLPAFIIEE